MKNFTVSVYISIAANNEEEAWEIADRLELKTTKPEDEEKIYWNTSNTEVEEEPNL